MATPRRAGLPRVGIHPFTVDPDTPADGYTGLHVCLTCSKTGRPGDAQHPADAHIPPPLPPALAAAARARDAAILGERDD